MTSTPLELVLIDLLGPAPMSSYLHCYRYYVSFVDDYSRYYWLFPLILKFNAFETFQNFKALV